MFASKLIRFSPSSSSSSSVRAANNTISVPRHLLQNRRGLASSTATATATSQNFLDSTLEYPFPSYLLKHPSTRVTTLPNGFRVASEESHGQTATIGVIIAAGSRYETDANNGVAHFLEHMNFKGTKTRSLRDIELEYENMGGHLNAYTSREHTYYSANVYKNDVEKAVSSIADLLQNSRHDKAAIEAERGTILKEMEEVERIAEEVILDQLHATAYQGTPLAYTILGPEKNIKSITREQIQDYVATHYTGPRMVLVGAGQISHDQLVKYAESYFGKVPAEPPQNKKYTLIPARFTGSDVRIHNEERPTTNISFGFEGPGWTHPDSLVIQVIQGLLGSWDITCGAAKNTSSLLAQKVYQYGIARSVSAFSLMYQDTSLFGVHTISDPEQHQELCFGVMNEITRLCYRIREEEVARIKNQLKTQLLMNGDGSSPAIAEDIARQMIFYGRRISPAELYARIDAITADDVKRVANQYIYDRDPVMAAYGDITEIPDYNLLRSWTYWLRY